MDDTTMMSKLDDMEGVFTDFFAKAQLKLFFDCFNHYCSTFGFKLEDLLSAVLINTKFVTFAVTHKEICQKKHRPVTIYRLYLKPIGHGSGMIMEAHVIDQLAPEEAATLREVKSIEWSEEAHEIPSLEEFREWMAQE